MNGAAGIPWNAQPAIAPAAALPFSTAHAAHLSEGWGDATFSCPPLLFPYGEPFASVTLRYHRYSQFPANACKPTFTSQNPPDPLARTAPALPHGGRGCAAGRCRAPSLPRGRTLPLLPLATPSPHRRGRQHGAPHGELRPGGESSGTPPHTHPHTPRPGVGASRRDTAPSRLTWHGAGGEPTAR